MIPHGTKIKVFTGNSNPELAQQIAAQLGLEVGKATVTKFSDGEISVSIGETVRGCDVFVIQSTCSPVNDNLMPTAPTTSSPASASPTSSASRSPSTTAPTAP